MTEPLLSIRDLTKTFGGVHAVDGVSLDVRPRETVALIGPNGAGKTTFYNMISGRMTPTSGSIHYDGEEITGLPPHRISRLGISRSFQITNIFQELTVRQNVEVALTAFHGKALAMLRLASRDREIIDEAYALLERLGLEALADQRAGVLSYGDKRLLEIAIVLATRPRLVLLDEPTAGMTPEETRHVTQLIRRLADSGDYTFLVTEHDMSVVFGIADRILVMHRGQRLAEGTPEEIRNDPEVKRAYLGEEEEEAAS
ncbi:amino acid/amide ABC transporter ATP-binding protein 1 (HAAT family) [Halomonas ventosae]|uniref:Amino acid/amide ABC transporter ATP-binding protein 1 (HAAT family) n=1 Tax=Halomonas ventosae TaxID=229007 RepID=A0A4V3DPQ8_9GAMM|nr:ABC transporter ATP-binding protein [Halomonas ventosae]TDR53316.1 amino acid/amide ABC transporter ATP-binding protein 1 (HAAT family) [Halomonas ventosae]